MRGGGAVGPLGRRLSGAGTRALVVQEWTWECRGEGRLTTAMRFDLSWLCLCKLTVQTTARMRLAVAPVGQHIHPCLAAPPRPAPPRRTGH